MGKALKKLPTGKVSPIPGKTIALFKDVLRAASPMETSLKRDPQDTVLLMYTGDTSSMPEIIDELEGMIREKSLTVNQMFKFAGDLRGVEMNGLSSSVGACFAGLGIGTYKFNLLPHKADYEIKKIENQ